MPFLQPPPLVPAPAVQVRVVPPVAARTIVKVLFAPPVWVFETAMMVNEYCPESVTEASPGAVP